MSRDNPLHDHPRSPKSSGKQTAKRGDTREFDDGEHESIGEMEAGPEAGVIKNIDVDEEGTGPGGRNDFDKMSVKKVAPNTTRHEFWRKKKKEEVPTS